MKVGRICTRQVIALRPEDTVSRAASLMRDNHVGAVVIHSAGSPVGIVTDRDIVVRCGGRLEALGGIYLRDVMTADPTVAHEDEDVLDVLDRMREQGIRRIPVVNDAKLLAGMLTLDDILLHVARSMRHVAEVVMAEISREA